MERPLGFKLIKGVISLNWWILLFSLQFLSIAPTVDGMHSTVNEDLALERQLNIVNKSHIKSTHTMSGYIVDCVDINNQPAFDHLLLKNHKLQRKPSFETQNSEISVTISPTKSIHVLEKVTCLKGTVPIRRITKNNLIRGKSLFNDHILTRNSIRTYYAELFAIAPCGPYYGVSGTTSIYNPKVFEGQISASHIYVENGKGDGNNKISVGWHVFPPLYKNDATHFYSTWTSQNYKNGCYNMLCPGFVQTNRAYYLGSHIANTSSTVDLTKVEMPISLLHDEKTKNWWLYISYQNKDRKKATPAEDLTRKILNAPAKCYAIDYYEYDGKEAGHALEFGGPGGYCGN
ncbi:hypothetical protein P8452_41448 [Trifolium repens]|nr:hypothetical protein P8452_41448 [Trifolium repens]